MTRLPGFKSGLNVIFVIALRLPRSKSSLTFRISNYKSQNRSKLRNIKGIVENDDNPIVKKIIGY